MVPPLSGRIYSCKRQLCGGRSRCVAARNASIKVLTGSLGQAQVNELANVLLTDPVAETSSITRGFAEREDRFPAIEVQVKPGVMNPVAMSTLDAVGRMIGSKIDAVQTGRRYEIIGAKSAAELELIDGEIRLAEAGTGRNLPSSMTIPEVANLAHNFRLSLPDDSEMTSGLDASYVYDHPVTTEPPAPRFLAIKAPSRNRCGSRSR